jgi:uncharacterized membrane protein SpoIIM required for sporulation
VNTIGASRRGTVTPVDLDAYVAEHAGEWHRLEQLSRRRRLSAEESDELIALYQRTATHLSVIRSRSPDPALVARLSRMVLAGRAAITGGPGFSWSSVGRFFTVGFPLEVYRARGWWIGTSLASIVVSGLVMWYVATHPQTQHALFSEDEIDQLVNVEFAGYYTQFQAQNFAFQVWTHNAFLTGICLAAGVLLLPVVLVLAQNALSIGLIGGLMIGHGRADVFFGLILPHGLLELTAMFVSAGVGLRIGWAWVAPGPYRTRGQALAETARSGMVVALGLVGVLAVTGFLEAFITPSGWPTAIRVGLGVLAWAGFLAYVWILGSRAARAGESADIAPELRETLLPTA